MFLTGAYVGLNGGFGGPDPESERDPPSDPTPVSFPHHCITDRASWTPSAAPDFHSVFAHIQRSEDISDRHLAAFNVDVSLSVSVDDMLPSMRDGSSYMPPLVLPSNNAGDLEAEDKMRKAFDDRVGEFRMDNDTAFRVVTRQPVKGVKPHLAYTRKFWEGLEVMSQYWDCSLDHFWESVPSSGEEEEARSAKRPRSTTNLTNGGDQIMDVSTYSAPTDNVQDEQNAQCIDGNPLPSLPESPKPCPSRRYKGRRTSTGRNMPELFRVTTVKAFVESAVWPFRASVSNPRVMPIVQFGKLNMPVRQTAAVYRIPDDRTRARQGWLTGPILSVQVRAEVEFVTGSAEETTKRSRLDLMRELGGLLQIAQERRRQNRTEVKPGEGKWWTSKRRWGGGPGGEADNETGNRDVIGLAENASGAVQHGDDYRSTLPPRTRKKKAPVSLWKDLRCGKGYWDPRIDYKAVGKPAKSTYDEIFMVSALNHHISIVKLTVHDKYTDWLISGLLPNPLPTDEQWTQPRLQRSVWFDVFDKEQRVEAFRSLWGVMAYMTRQ